MFRSTLLVVLALALSGACTAKDEPTAEQAMELTGRVVDQANVLEPEFETQLSDALAQLEADSLVQLVVATTPSLDGHDIADYSRDLGNSWGLGDADRNDGLLVVVAPNERKVRIAVGLGLEDVITNEEASAIIENHMLPEFRRGNYEAGVSAGVKSLMLEVEPIEQKEAA